MEAAEATEAEEKVQSHASQWERGWGLKSFSDVARGGAWVSVATDSH